MMAMGRTQLVPVLAIGLLLFVWALRWQISGLTFDYSWVGGSNEDSVSSGASGSPSPDSSDSQPATGVSVGSSSSSGTKPKKPVVPQALGKPLPPDLDLSDPDAPFVSWPLRRACDEVEEWLDGVTFVCDNNFGGVGNVRNFILTCVRYAIEAGATGLVMPAIRKRKDDNIKVIFDASDFRPFRYLFDEQNFRDAMGENCPRITLYDDVPSVPHISYVDGDVPDIQKIDPRQMGREWGKPEKCDFAELDHQTDRFGERFKLWLANPENGSPPSKTNTRMFRGNDWPGVLWEWPVYHDGPELANTFGGLCKFNRTMMRLGKAALANMQAFARDHSRSRGLHQGKGADADAAASKFLGAHLRTEADAEPFWPTYEDQERGYLDKAAETGLAVGYIASGNLTETHKFAKAAMDKIGLTLVSKDDLLGEADLAELHSLSWDQQGLVDYIVLAGAEYFTGNSRSSFSISMCLKRNLKEEGLYSRQYKVRYNGHGRSYVVGPKDRYYDHWLFIWDAMWP